MTSRSRRANPAGCLVVFFFLFFAAGAAVFYFLFLKPVAGILAAREWVPTPCQILSSEVRRHRGSKGRSTYSVHVVFQYEYNGQKYTSSRYQFMTTSTSGRASKAAVVRKLRPGTRATCYVDPKNPAEAVMMRDFTAALWLGLIPLVFIVVGAGGMWATATGRIASRRISSARIPGRVRAATMARQSMSPITSGPVTLKAKASRKAMFIGGILVAGFWNGIVSVFVWQAIASWRRGSTEWFLTIFLIPFVLIGLLLIGFVGYSFLQLFNPRVTLTVDPGAAPLGGAFTLQWRVDGRVARLDKLTLSLEGREEVTYRRGTSTVTDKNVFARQILTSVTNKMDMRAGRVQGAAPAESMHSFETTSNKILWSITVHADIPNWPDIQEEYPFTVLPQPVTSVRPT